MRPRAWVGSFCALTAVLLATSADAAGQRLDRRSWETRVLAPLFFTRPPTVTSNPNPSAPLAKFVEFALNRPIRARVLLEHGDSWRLLFASQDFSLDHALPILGLRPGRTERIRIVATDLLGNETEWPSLEIVTEPLPRIFPEINVTVSQPHRMEPGVTLFSLSTPGAARYGLLVAVDEAGEVVWYYQSENGIGDARRLRNGNLLIQDAGGAAEIDMLGNIHRRWRPLRPAVADTSSENIPLATDQLHHEIYEMATGNFLSLSLELRRLHMYPSSETDPQSPAESADVVGDLVVEYRADGMIVNQWSLFDILDPFRIVFGSLAGIWNSTYPEAQAGTRDWSHGNAVIYDPSDDSMIVSLRHQDAVIKISRATGHLVWILGTHDGWRSPWNRYLLSAEGSLEWPYHQHAPEITPHGTLLLFDNGNFRRSPFDDRPEKNYSRVVEYAIDSRRMTVSEVWSYGGPYDEVFFSNALGDADWLPGKGNVLMTDGSRVGAGAPVSRFARIVELTHTKPAEKVFEIIMTDAPGGPPFGWRVYRSERLPGLYPAEINWAARRPSSFPSTHDRQ